jgi:hypothetical protein
MLRYKVGIEGFTACLSKLVELAQNQQHYILAYDEAFIGFGFSCSPAVEVIGRK